jgi:glycosyltransferase 2 family protein
MDMKLRNVQILLGLGCTFAFLALAFRHVPIGAVRETLVNVRLPWIAAAILIYAANLSLRAWRWQLILRTFLRVPYLTVARALLVGYGLNAIMPARLGEFFRAEFCKNDFGLARPPALTSIVIERLFDGLTVVICLGTGLLLATTKIRLSQPLLDVLAIAALLFGGSLVVLLALSGTVLSQLFASFPELAARLALVEQGLRVLRTRRAVGLAIVTAIIYVPDSLSLWLLMKAVGIGLGLASALVLVGAASLSTLIPSGPAFLGTLQFAYALAMEFAGAPRELGIAAATLAQLVFFLPLALVATGILVHGSGRILFALPAKPKPARTPAEP